MTISIETAQDIHYADSSNSQINLLIKFPHLSESVPFTATADDPMDYGRQLYQDLLSGKYGTIQPYDNSI